MEIQHQAREEKIKLNGGLERRLKADLHHSGGRVKNLGSLQLLLPRNLLCSFGEVILAVVIIFDEEDSEWPKCDATEESDGVYNEFDVAVEHGFDTPALRHLVDNLGSFGNQGVVMTRGEKFVNKEGPGDEDEKESIAELGMRIHSIGETGEANILSFVPILFAFLLTLFVYRGISRHANPIVISAARFDILLLTVCRVGQAGVEDQLLPVLLRRELIPVADQDQRVRPNVDCIEDQGEEECGEEEAGPDLATLSL